MMQGELFPLPPEEELELLADRIAKVNALTDPERFDALFERYLDLAVEIFGKSRNDTHGILPCYPPADISTREAGT